MKYVYRSLAVLSVGVIVLLFAYMLGSFVIQVIRDGFLLVLIGLGAFTAVAMVWQFATHVVEGDTKKEG